MRVVWVGMRGLRLCCEGVFEPDINVEAEPTDKTIVVPSKTESFHKPREATVIPAKRVCVKKMMCSCFLHCMCPKSSKTNTKHKPFHAAGNHFTLLYYSVMLLLQPYLFSFLSDLLQPIMETNQKSLSRTN